MSSFCLLPATKVVRTAPYQAQAPAFLDAGVPWEKCHQAVRGDGCEVDRWPSPARYGDMVALAADRGSRGIRRALTGLRVLGRANKVVISALVLIGFLCSNASCRAAGSAAPYTTPASTWTRSVKTWWPETTSSQPGSKPKPKRRDRPVASRLTAR